MAGQEQSEGQRNKQTEETQRKGESGETGVGGSEKDQKAVPEIAGSIGIHDSSAGWPRANAARKQRA